MGIRGWRRESCRGTGRWRATVVGHRSRWRTGRGGGGMREGGGRLGEERERAPDPAGAVLNPGPRELPRAAESC
jgi:hypothetical protein